MGDWLQSFAKCKEMIAKREELRKAYDHYDAKMENLYKSSKGSKSDDVVRNEDKFKFSTREYLDMSYSTYQQMMDAIDGRYEVLSPIIARVKNVVLIFLVCRS